ncbi:hypothetical protein PVAND_007496 [Polypedilum vanderplanki]|uniref:Pupal cuticle protein Edg-78E n=1 Tax=Polypedilum vanderplanki TaxID=319348 RepID=A0A9J6C753_POLVA|nr:hypothetical protein PVAND_007496 [Polypedilum vanderplanki]
MSDQNAITLEQISNINFDGTYSYVYRTSNNINAEESGKGGESVSGSYSYISNDGQQVELTYEADHLGYRPQSDFLPQDHPIPEYIQRALDYIRNNPPNFKK